MTENETAEETASPKMMGFGEAIQTCFKKYFSFHGCATRAEYWWFSTFVVVGQALLLVPLIVATRLYFRVHTMGALELMVAFACLAFLFNIAVMLPMLSVGVRRMHDTGNAGFLHFVPVVNFIILLLPSEKTSEYRSGYNIHSVRNALGKMIFVFTLVSYVLYMGTIISNAVLLSLMVLYGRPTKENMLEYTDGAAKTETQYAERKLAFGVDDYEEAYETVKNFTITWNPTVTIGGIEYEVIFTDIDDD